MNTHGYPKLLLSVVLGLTLAGSLMFSSCRHNPVTPGSPGTSGATNALQLVIVAAEAAVGTLGATGALSPAVVADLDGYLNAVSQATSFAATELASSDTSLVKATKILGQFAAIAKPNLPNGTAQTIVAVIQAVTNAVGNFIATVQTAAPPANVRAAAPAEELVVTKADKTALVSIKVRADRLAAKTK